MSTKVTRSRMLLEASSSGHMLHRPRTPSPYSNWKHPPQSMQRLMPRTERQSCNHTNITSLIHLQNLSHPKIASKIFSPTATANSTSPPAPSTLHNNNNPTPFARSGPQQQKKLAKPRTLNPKSSVTPNLTFKLSNAV